MFNVWVQLCAHTCTCGYTCVLRPRVDVKYLLQLLSKLFGVGVYVCNMCSHMCMCACRSQRRSAGILFNSSMPYSLETGSLTVPGAGLAARTPQYLYPPLLWDYRYTRSHTQPFT